MAGPAQLTKSSAIIILVPIGVILLIQVISTKAGWFPQNSLGHCKGFYLWLLALVALMSFFRLECGVAPDKMLYQVYGNAFSYAFQGANLTVTENLHASNSALTLALQEFWI